MKDTFFNVLPFSIILSVILFAAGTILLLFLIPNTIIQPTISEQDCRFFRFFASAYLATKTIPNRLATTANTKYIKSCDI